MKNIKSFSVLLAEVNTNYSLFVVNCLSEIKGIKIYIISNNINSEIKHSIKITNFSFYAYNENDLEWISNINKELKKYEIDIIMPVNEHAIETLIKFKEDILYKEKLILLPPLNSFYIANDKGSLANHLSKNKIPKPKNFLIRADEKFDGIKNLSFPVLIKPTHGFSGGKGIFKFYNIEDLKLHLNSNNLYYDILIEEYIEGYDIDCSVLCKNGKTLAFTIQKGILGNVSDFEPNVGLEFLFSDDLFISVEKLMKTLDWSGVAHLDMRYDEKDNKFKVIEINPRFWGSIEASEIAGVNFPYLYCLSTLNIVFKIPKYTFIKVLNLKGLKPAIKSNIFLLFNLKFILNNTPIKYYLRDPLPLIYIMFNKIKSMLKN